MSRIAAALNSDDLSHKPTDCDVDVLLAAGLVAIHRNLGILIIEAREGAAGDGAHSVARIKDLERALGRHIKRLAMRWGLRVDVGGVAVKVTKELILDRCVVCHGRGVIPMCYDGNRMIAVLDSQESLTKDVECSFCLGSGAARRDYHGRARAAGFADYSRKLGEWWEAVLQSCCDAEISARNSLWKRLRENHNY